LPREGATAKRDGFFLSWLLSSSCVGYDEHGLFRPETRLEPVVMDYSTEMTCLIRQAQTGENQARERRYALFYDDLHREAEHLVLQNGPAALASSLVHKGYRLFRDGRPLDIPGRRYFFFAASRKMRDSLASQSVKEAVELLEISHSQSREDERLALAELVVEVERREP
jgi:hypothetical protein